MNLEMLLHRSINHTGPTIGIYREFVPHMHLLCGQKTECMHSSSDDWKRMKSNPVFSSCLPNSGTGWQCLAYYIKQFITIQSLKQPLCKASMRLHTINVPPTLGKQGALFVRGSPLVHNNTRARALLQSYIRNRNFYFICTTILPCELIVAGLRPQQLSSWT